MSDAQQVWLDSVVVLLSELLDGPPGSEAYILNPGDAGFLQSLENVSAVSASTVPPDGDSSIAAHVDHLLYCFQLLNRWVSGETNPFATADYAASWKRGTVTDVEWDTRRAALAAEVRRWSEAIKSATPNRPVERQGIVSSVVHLAYHIGAIRQIDRSSRGPKAKD